MNATETEVKHTPGIEGSWQPYNNGGLWLPTREAIGDHNKRVAFGFDGYSERADCVIECDRRNTALLDQCRKREAELQEQLSLINAELASIRLTVWQARCWLEEATRPPASAPA